MSAPAHRPESRLTALAAGLPDSVPFVGPEALQRRLGLTFRARLGANESGFGPAPSVIAALQAAAPEVWCYGDPEGHELRHAIAAHHKIPADCVALGEGIDGLLGLLVRLTVGAGEKVVMPLGGYPTFAFHVNGFGGELDLVPYVGDHEDLEAMIDRARQVQARLVYVANPDNPMGTCHPGAAIAAALNRLGPETLLVLDEAYIELAPEGTAPELAPDDPRLIRLRTFSKAHGLAGLRVGYAIAAPGLVRAFDKVRNHFALGRLAQAGAQAAVQAQDWVQHIQAEVGAARARIGAIAANCGLRALPSATNFVAVDCGAGAARARGIVAALARRGVFVRMPGVFPLDRCIRISCGPASALDVLARTLPDAVAEAVANA
jgi:histidinol-phosphate aminotransferase